MISFKNKFIFIHAHKTAGNSIQNILIEYSDDVMRRKKGVEEYRGREIFNRFEIDSPHFPKSFKHMSLNHYSRWWKRDYGEFTDFIKFGCVRNPWDRAISLYFWYNDFYNKPKPFNEQEFKEWFKKDALKAGTCKRKFLVNGEYRLDFLMKYENLQEDFNQVCTLVGIPQQTLPVTNAIGREHYSMYYSKETRELVAELWSDDISLGNYEFEDLR